MRSPNRNYQILDNVTLLRGRRSSNAKTNSFSKFPFIFWPNGSPCHIANMYITRKSKNNPEITADGRIPDSKAGTLGQYATYISQLTRYCFTIKCNPIDLTDSTFTDFIEMLSLEPKQSGKPGFQRDAATVVKIANECIQFLSFVGKFYGEPGFIHVDGTISLNVKETVASTFRVRAKTSLTHHSLPIPNREHHRGPISDENIIKMQDAAASISTSDFIEARRLAMLTAFEHTGARRREVASITIPAIRAALKMKIPMLTLVTLKKKGPATRSIPFNAIALNDIKKYIVYREQISARFPTERNDYLFISEKTGAPLKPETLGSEVYKLRMAAGIEEQACAHMFRHAFLTNLFIALLETHKSRSRSEFEAALLSEKDFLKELRKWTGHTNLQSLYTYLDNALALVSKKNDTTTSVHSQRIQALFDKKLVKLTDALARDVITKEQFISDFKELRLLRDNELQRYSQAEQSHYRTTTKM